MGILDTVNQDALSADPSQAAMPPYTRGIWVNFELHNDISAGMMALMAVAIFLGCILARATLIAARNRQVLLALPQSLGSSFLGLSSNLCVFAAMIFGFLVTHWYWPIGFFLMSSLIASLLVHGNTVTRIIAARNLIALIILTAIVCLGLLYWDKV